MNKNANVGLVIIPIVISIFIFGGIVAVLSLPPFTGRFFTGGLLLNFAVLGTGTLALIKK